MNLLEFIFRDEDNVFKSEFENRFECTVTFVDHTESDDGEPQASTSSAVSIYVLAFDCAYDFNDLRLLSLQITEWFHIVVTNCTLVERGLELYHKR